MFFFVDKISFRNILISERDPGMSSTYAPTFFAYALRIVSGMFEEVFKCDKRTDSFTASSTERHICLFAVKSVTVFLRRSAFEYEMKIMFF